MIVGEKRNDYYGIILLYWLHKHRGGMSIHKLKFPSMREKLQFPEALSSSMNLKPKSDNSFQSFFIQKKMKNK
jgi:hypothetical protein